LDKENRTKANIFEAAARLFSEKGFTGTTLRNIAGAPSVRVSETAIYRHFESKAAILDEIFSVFRVLPKSYIPSRSRIDVYLKTDTPRQLLTHFIPTCEDEDALFMTQVYRILFREQFTNQGARDIVNDHLIGEAADSLRYALERLMEAEVIPKMDAKAIARLWAVNMFTITSANGFAKPNLLADGMIHMMLTGKLPGITNNPPA